MIAPMSIKAIATLWGPLCLPVGTQTPLFFPLLQSQLPMNIETNNNSYSHSPQSYLNVDDMPVTLKYVCGLG